jgi:hypothetical protein
MDAFHAFAESQRRTMKSALVLVASVLVIATGSAAPSITNTTTTSTHSALGHRVNQQSTAVTPSARAGNSGGTLLADQRWIGRAVHSSDGKYLGDVAALNEDDQQEFYVDLGGFLALGETRIIRISSDQLLEVDDNRIVLRLTEPEARNQPTPDSQAQDL